MEISLQKTEKTYVRLIVALLGAFVLLVLVCWAGFRFYHDWQERHLLRRSAAYLSGGDIRAAGLSARRAYQLNPEGAGASRMLAQIAEAAGEKAALDWRRKVVQLEPGSAEDQIALAKCALQFGDTRMAEKALTEVRADQKSAGFFAVAGQLAEARHKLPEAREHWRKAAQLDPTNKAYQLQLAIVSLDPSDPAARESARTTLLALRSDPGQRAAATRALIADGAANRADPEEVVALARELQGYSEATFNDVLLCLEILRQLRHPDFTSFLTEVEQKAQARPNDLASLISWMNRNTLSALALNYAGRLNPDLLPPWPVPLALAESYAVLGDWTGLEKWVNAHPWGSFEFLRRAYLARSLRGQDKTVAADREWNAAKKEASNQTRQLALLTRTIIEWRWTGEAVDLLWTLAKDPTEQSEALQSLYQHYAANGDTAGLYRVLLRLVEVLPGDLSLQNNLAQIGLLLNAEPDRARQLANDVYQKEPKNPAYISTYAFSFFSKGDVAQAVRTMNSLSPEQLRDPSIAAYYGIFLAAAGDREKARDYLKLGSGANLLPEEKELMQKAARAN